MFSAGAAGAVTWAKMAQLFVAVRGDGVLSPFGMANDILSLRRAGHQKGAHHGMVGTTSLSALRRDVAVERHGRGRICSGMSHERNQTALWILAPAWMVCLLIAAASVFTFCSCLPRIRLP